MNKLLKIIADFDLEKYNITKIIVEDKDYNFIIIFFFASRYIQMVIPERVLLIHQKKDVFQALISEFEEEYNKIKPSSFKESNI